MIQVKNEVNVDAPEVKFNDQEESLLWMHFKSGDRKAFSQIFKKYYSALNTYGLYLNNDEGFVDDCIQELFLELWIYRQTVSEVKSIKFYLLSCFRRKVIRNIEKIKIHKKRSLSLSFDADKIDSYEHEIIKGHTSNLKKHHLLQGISLLPKRQQEAICLRFYQDLSYEEITEIMSLNYQSVKNLIHNGIKQLRQKLNYNHFISVLLFGLSQIS